MKKIFGFFIALISLIGISSCTFSFGSGDVYDPGENIVNPTEKTSLDDNYDDFYKRYYYNSIKKIPSSGNVKLLVIPIWFTDSTTLGFDYNKQSTYISKINDAVFGTEQSTGWHSVSSYYKAESHEILNITGKVTSFYDCGKATSSITSNTVTKNLATDATRWYANNNDDLNDYDSDNDGYIDAVILIYAAPNYNSSLYEENSVQKTSETLWAFTHWANSTIGTKKLSPYVFASFDFLEKDISHCNIDAHTLIHETGHALGLTDYYDYNADANMNYAGGFSMQDFNVGGHDPYSVMALGWANPYLVNTDCELVIKDFQSSGDLIMVPAHGDNSKSLFNEYLLLELYTSSGLNYFDVEYNYCSGKYVYPKGSKNFGIRVWHVDSRLIYSATINGAFSNNAVIGVGNSGYYYYATSNTTYDNEGADSNQYATKVEQYRPYQLLTLIRNNDYACEKLKTDFSNADLFVAGDTFNTSTYSAYFNNTGKLNKGIDFDYNISILDCSNLGARIKIETIEN